MVKNKKAFTLVELLAVIVILAVILVIAVPQIMNTITESRKGALASSAKLIASSAETAYISNQTLGIEKDIECSDVSNYTAEDYKSCDIEFVDGKAKVSLVGQGKFEGMAVCGGTKEEAEVAEPINGKCPTPFEKDSWATIKAAVRSGDTSKYKVGDTKTVELDINDDGTYETYTLRIANNSHYTNEDENKNECKDTTGNALASETACGFVIEFADIITTHNMNPSGEYNGTQYDYGWNKDGWPASSMHDYVNGDIYNALPEELRNAIIDTIVVSSHGSEDTSNFTSTDKLFLLSTREVWGKEGTSNTIDYDSADGNTITRQLDYYKNNNVTTSNYSGAIKKNSSNSESFWWLRSAHSDNNKTFYTVSSIGDWSSYNATNTGGVSPAFRLG